MIKEPLTIKFKSNQHGFGKTIIDGKDLSSHIRKVEIKCEVGEATTIKVEFINIDIEVEIEN